MSTHSALQPVHETGWRRGFANLLSKETGAWWRTRRWLVQTIIWVAILNGILAMLLFAVPDAEVTAQGVADRPSEGALVFMTLSLVALAIGVIIIAQEAILDETRSGTAAWVLSKPVSRVAFILSKLIAHGLGLLATGVLIPGTLALILLSAAGGSIAPGGFVAALGMAFLNVLFYLTLTLMLGTLFEARGAVIGIPMAFVFGYQLLLGLAPWLADITPWGFLGQAASPVPPITQVALGQATPPLAPILATALWCVLFTAVALWRFGREEF
ncbi:MAG TPA: ABC transporter permease subunit [Anaerolineae bacterium]|nr:ABC transporter permease subunit [Anaerolineae bacterium]